MIKFVQYIVILATVTLPALCLANSAVPGPYMSAFIGLHVPTERDVSSTDYVTGNSYYDRVELDPGVNMGFAGGYDFGIVRLEGEMSYKNAEIKSINNQLTGERFHNAVGDLGVFAMMFNGFMNLHNNSAVIP